MVDAGSNNNNNLKGAMFEMYCNLHGLKYLQVYYKYREEESGAVVFRGYLKQI